MGPLGNGAGMGIVDDTTLLAPWGPTRATIDIKDGRAMLNPRDPSMQITFTLGPRVHKAFLLWAICIPR